jgi:Lipoprotein LpqB beta-propeller domain/Sporulation and spore germination
MIVPHGHRRARRAGTWRPPATAAFAAALLAAGALAGCAEVPSSGPVQNAGSGQSGVSQEQDYSQPIPVGPDPGWTPTQIVEGFLAASASFASNHAVARQYLDTQKQRSWKPGWAVTVVGATPTASIVKLPKQFAQQPGNGVAHVEVTGQPVATLTGSGQYLVSSGPPTKSFSFILDKINGLWRIASLPSTLLLTQADFQRVYQPRDLYYLAPSGRTLVPDPVFVPQQATDTDLATGLVNALLEVPTGWLSGAAGSGFPSGSRQIGQVKIIGPNAVVNLGGSAAGASPQRKDQMAAQLAWTLTSGPTSSIHSVELELDGRPQLLLGSTFQLPQTYHNWVPAQSAGSALYFIGSGGAISTLSGPGQPGSGRAVLAGAPRMPALSAIAVSPDGRSVAGISADGSTVYISVLGRDSAPQEWRSPSGSCTSLSWDAQGNLWVAAGGALWLLPPGATSAESVDLDFLPAGDQVAEFKVAPDGVRAVMIVSGVFDGKPGTQIQLAAITRSGLTASVGGTVPIGGGIADPQAVSWYGADDVIALSGGASGAQLNEVPLGGGQPVAIATPSGTTSMTATSPSDSSSYIAVGLSGGQIMVSADLAAFQPIRASGAAVAYPG